MNRRKLLILLAGLVFIGCDIVILTWYFTRPKTTGYQEPKLSFDGSSDQLQHTVIVPTLDTPIPEGKNAIWCASFQIAWNKLKTDVAKGPVQIQGAEEIAKRLNDSTVTEADLPEGSYYAAAGLSRDGIEKTIQSEMRRRFPRWQSPEPTPDPNRTAVAYAYLESEVAFETLFDELEEPLTFTDSQGRASKLGAFGITRKTIKEHRDHRLSWQIRVLAAKSPDEFAVQLLGMDDATQLILIRLPRAGTLADCVRNAESLFKVGPVRSVGDTLTVPVMNWQIDHHYRQLEGSERLIRNAPLPDSFLAVAYQLVRFKLDRSGAVLKSEALLVAKGPDGATDPIELDFTRPFLILLKKRGAAQPFFVMWVDNAELLQKWGE